MKRTIVALDFKDRESTIRFLDKFEESIAVKIGMELFYKEGPEIVREIKRRGHDIFLDLKICDIPNTAKGAFRSLASLDVDMINLHCYGGKKMMEEAMNGLKEGAKGKLPLAIGVTILTSFDQDVLNNEIGIPGFIADSAIRFAKLAKESGLGGVVCSTFEARKIHEVLGKDFVTVCPGIRLKSQDNQDQKRVATPEVAREEGVDFIVVGRAITGSEDPVKSYRAIKEAFENGRA